MDKSILKFRKRRDERIRKRLDSEDTGWRTTEDKRRIHIGENGACDIGNQYVIAGMGKPNGAELPKKVNNIKEERPYKYGAETKDKLYESIKNRKEKDCIFGGFYKVSNESSSSFKRAKFFNPYTGQEFSETIEDYDYEAYTGPNSEFRNELGEIPINDEVRKIYNRSKGIVGEGDSVVVVKGRTIPKGTKAKVRKIYPFKDKYGRYLADYAYLDNGQKINVANLALDDD